MLLQKLLHSNDDTLCLDHDVIVTHVVNEVVSGGEFTVCGCAIPDSTISVEGWEASGLPFNGSINDCDCPLCLRVISYFKSLT